MSKTEPPDSVRKILVHRRRSKSALNNNGGTSIDSSSQASKQPTVIGDNPIRCPEDDTLGRADVAQSFARQVLSLDASEGIVVGVLGPWGAGKTSFINLARSHFSESGAPILDFNPWMFSGTEQLVEAFFSEIMAQLQVKQGFDELVKEIEAYAGVLSWLKVLPVVGPWVESGAATTKLLGRVLRRHKDGMTRRRLAVANALAKLGHPIIVVLDDLDRLSSSEIRDIFRLVRLTASFPNIIYIVAFDRGRVEDALAEQGVPGRAYLEKILQVAVDLPIVSRPILRRQALTAIDKALVGIDNLGPFDSESWPDLFMEIVQPPMRNMRDVRRYAMAVLQRRPLWTVMSMGPRPSC